MSGRRWVLTAAQMREADRYTTEKLGMPVLELMECAGQGLAESLLDRFAPERGASVLVMCGKGNNGGDGMVAARLLRKAGCKVTVLLLGKARDLKGPARTQWTRLANPAIPRFEVDNPTSMAGRQDRIAGFDLLVDALLGTGARGPLDPLLNAACEALNLSGKPVIAVDLPTGVDATTGEAQPEAVRAALTVSFAYPKFGHLLHPGRAHCGQLDVVDIGIPEEALPEGAHAFEVLTPRGAQSLLPHRPEDAHKGDMGRILIVGGSAGMLGAPALAARAALRTGSGLATVCVPRSLYDPLAPLLLEATALLCEESPGRTHTAAAAGAILVQLKTADALALGPGLSRSPDAGELARALVAGSTAPVVLDADGLNAFEGRTDELKPRRAPAVLTPHAGELARLAGLSRPEVESRRLSLPLECAQRWNAVVVLKGSPTVIASPDGRARLNPTGNAGMATGGVGDVLTGMIASLLGRGMDAFDAASLAAYLHGLAGDLAVGETGRESLLASDLLAYLPEAFLNLEGI